MMRVVRFVACFATLVSTLFAFQGPGHQNNAGDPYHVGLGAPKLTTPQWVGEPGVEAVVILAIDDMGENTAKYEQFLRPILNRLKQIDGRAALSIMSNSINPNDPQLQTWLKEGVSIECHTLTHPCPLLANGDFKAAQTTYHDCVDLVAKIPGNTPVAFRMPCCDSINSVSPRFFREIMAKPSSAGRRLSIDTSVFCVLTPDDPDLPRDLVFDPDGRERFRKYLPFKSFVNTIENYPYPYVIDGVCWEFPCIVPSDWEAQNIQKPNNPKTLEDMKAALDAVVIKQGVMNLVFHPHGWIQNEQLVGLIDYATAKHGKKVKFLNFREAYERLTRAQPDALKSQPTNDTGRRLVDINDDGVRDLIVSDDDECFIELGDPWGSGQPKRILDAKPGSPEALPKIASNGQSRGFWAHSRHLWWQNEDTAQLPDRVDRRSFNDLLKNVEPLAKSPAASLASIKVRPGYTVELAAAEPLTQDPVAFDWDERGRLWIVEMADYPLGEDGKGKPCGRVRVLDDINHDGTYDQSQIFLEDLKYPNGVMCWRNGVIISCAPDIFYAEDSDHDGKADKREVLFTGFDESNPQHRVNGFALGLDGWVYAADGQSANGVISTKTGKTHELRGRDFRFNPDSGAFELCSGQGQFGRSRDDWGNWFANNNSVWAWHIPIEDSFLKRNPHLAIASPIQVADPDRRLFPISPILARFNDLDNAGLATSACSPAAYRDNLFGPWFDHNLFVCDPVHNLVHRVVLEPDGVTFKGRRAPGEEQSEFLASSDNWSRFVQVKTGPDGAIWVADMYRQHIEHPEWIPDDWEAKLDLRAGHDKGRIYRVFPVGTKPRPIRTLAGLDTAALVAAIDSPNGPQRDTAMRLLMHASDQSAAPALKQLAASAALPQVRLQALATLELLQSLDNTSLLTALSGSHPEIRRFAAERAGARANENPALAEKLISLAGDKTPRARMGAALGLGEFHGTAASDTLGTLLKADAEDPWLRTAALSSASPHAAEILSRLFTADAGEAESQAVIDPLLTIALSDDASRKATLHLVVNNLIGPATERWTYSDASATQLTGFLQTLRRTGLSIDRLRAILDPADAQHLGDRLRAIESDSLKKALDPEAPVASRRVALQLLSQREFARPEVIEALKPLVSAGLPPDLQRALLETMARVDAVACTHTVVENWKQLSPRIRAAALQVLISQPEALEPICDALEAGSIAPAELGAAGRQALLSHANDGVKQRAARIFASSPRADVLKAYATEIGRIQQGNAESGRLAFGRVCAVCHQFQGVGIEVGPNLAALTDRSPEALLMAILDPNRAFETPFTEYAVALHDGRVLSGMIAAETANSVTLRTQERKDEVLLRSEIEQLASAARSFMPEGLEKDLTPTDLANIIAFLNSQKSTPKRLEGNTPAVVQAADDGSITLPASAAEVYGSSLIFESKYENLGYWSQPDDHAAWTLESPAAATYDVYINYACSSEVSGNHFDIRVGAQSVEGIATSTGTWDHYRRKQRVGEVELAAGRNRLEVVPHGPIRGALMDLRAVILVPRR